MSDTRIPIGIAVVEHVKQFLIGVRGNDGPLAGCAEFPGGKCRPGEAPAACAVRECEEETGLRVSIVEPLFHGPYDYPHALVDLHFFLCRPTNADHVHSRQERFEWIAPGQLAELKFPPANRPVIELLIKRAARSNPNSM
ncbi:MAG: NUDIX domain-containing protein [Pirellulales bacterium]